MSALPVSPSESAVRAAIERLSRVQPGAYHVVSCYLKLEPRDKTRGKYLIKIKNRIREALAALQRQELERALRAQVAADLERVQAYFGEPTRLPPARGIARSEEHTSELQSLAYLVCRLIISEEHTSELQSLAYLVCRLLLEKKKTHHRQSLATRNDKQRQLLVRAVHSILRQDHICVAVRQS